MPVGTPLDPRGVHEIPAAGPYFVASERPTQVVLERNPNYRGDRPHRFDRIVLTGGVSQAQAISDIEKGRADYALDGVPGKATGRIVARYGPRSPAAAAGRQRYFEATQLSVQYLVLNTRRRLFSRLRLRRAVNYAIDRATLASLGAPSSDPAAGGPQIATPTSFRPACPAIAPPVRTRSGPTFGGRGNSPAASAAGRSCTPATSTFATPWRRPCART